MNSGDRLLRVFQGLSSQRRDSALTTVWANVFDLGSYTENDIHKLLIALRDEISITRGALIEKYKVPLDLFESSFNALNNTASPINLNSTWASHQGNLVTEQHRYNFKWVAWAMREERDSILSNDAIIEINTYLSELEKLLEDDEIPESLRSFIRRQVETIKSALDHYKVKGSKSVKDAVVSMYGEFVMYETHLKNVHDNGSPKEKSIIKKFSKMASGFSKGVSFFNDMNDAIGHAGDMVDKVVDMFEAYASDAPLLLANAPSFMSTASV